ncbi:MAG: gliding motility-associated-like protein [Saprospiraceae bacterium]|jgi:gliding motility-associated-like protein
MKNALPLLLFVFALAFSYSAQGQTIVFEDSDHIIYHEVIGDSIYISVEDFKDFSLDLTPDIDSSKIDYILFMFDVNQSGDIDPGTGTDVYYAYEITASNNTCKAEILNTTTLSACGSLTSNAIITATLKRTISNNTAHVVYSIKIPKIELLTAFTVCSRLSVTMHRAGDSKYTTSNFPNSADRYFVNSYYAVNLFEAIDLGGEIQFCAGDSVLALGSYPSYLWSDNSTLNFMTPKDSGSVHLTVKDNTCSMSDTVDVVIQDENYCNNVNLMFPNVVTPNNDGINDYFEPLASAVQNGLDYTGVELSIYNRWGVKVGGKKGQAPFWDCHLDWGQKAPPGTYYFVYNPGNSSATTVNGFFTILYTVK